MPTKQEMLAKIYEVIADKTLSMGLMVDILCTTDEDGGLAYNRLRCARVGAKGRGGDPTNMVHTFYSNTNEEYVDDKYTKIIGHPVMIGDVLDWMDKNPNYCSCLAYSCGCSKSEMIRNYKRLPIDQQSEECVKYVYNLLPPTK